MSGMDEYDKELLNLMQEGLPLCERPFLDLAQRLGLGEEDVISRVRSMKEGDIIRRIGGIFDSAAMGFAGTLCALSVPDGMVEEAASAINRHDGVTHNYLRDDKYNIWFTAAAPSWEDLNRMISEISGSVGADVLSFPTVKKFKVEARFPV